MNTDEYFHTVFVRIEKDKYNEIFSNIFNQTFTTKEEDGDGLLILKFQ